MKVFDIVKVDDERQLRHAGASPTTCTTRRSSHQPRPRIGARDRVCSSVSAGHVRSTSAGCSGQELSDDRLTIRLSPTLRAPTKSWARRPASPSTACTVPARHPHVGAVAARGRLEHPDARTARQLVPRRVTQQRIEWLVDGVPATSTSSPSTTTTPVLGSTATAGGMKQGLPTRLAIALPATIIPIGFAAFAAYALRLDRLQAPPAAVHRHGRPARVPLQVALIPLLLMYVNGAHWTIPCLDKTITVLPDLDLAGTTTAVWLTHTGVRHAVRHLPAAQLHLVAARRTSSSRRASTAPTTSRSSGGSCSRCRCRCWRRSPSSSSCGPGTTTWSPSR